MLLLLPSFLCLVASAASGVAPLYRGAHFLADGFEGRYKYDSPQAQATLRLAAAQTGLRDVTLSFVWYQDNCSSTVIGPIAGPCPSGTVYHNCSSPTDAELLAAIASSHGLGLRVQLRPMVDLDWRLQPVGSSAWRGCIGTDFNAVQWQRWFESYTAYMVHYARMAEAQQVALFCVSAELSGTQTQTAAWRQLIADVRAVYTGQLVFSTTNGNYQDVAFWDALDYVGVDAYLACATCGDNATVEDLVQGWHGQLSDLSTFSRAVNRSILFSETGSCALPGHVIYPNPSYYACYDTTYPLDLQAQATYYTAFFQAVWAEPWCAGVYFWKITTDTPGPADRAFSPLNKPAAQVMAHYFALADAG